MPPRTRTASRTASKSDARERARAARLRLDADRAERDRKLEEAATAFFVGDSRRTDLLAQVQEADQEMGRAVTDLVDLGETPNRIATLLGIATSEVRRLRSLGRPDGVSGDGDGDETAGEDGAGGGAEDV